MQFRTVWVGAVFWVFADAAVFAQDAARPLPLAKPPEETVAAKVAPRLVPAFKVLEKRQKTHRYRKPDLTGRPKGRRSGGRPEGATGRR